jgi:formylglycine-generating enzyme required for sulfatase activity
MADQERNPSIVTPRDSGQSIEPARFVPSDASEAGAGLNRWHVILGSLLLLVVFVLWFLFTSRSVQIALSPEADSVQISGGISFELGGVYLLRQGQYQVNATTPLHEPMEEIFTVGSERNQRIDLDFTPLPGFLQLQLTPADAQVRIDGVQVANAERVELPAGEHELAVSHPRYLPSSSIVSIEGKQIEQALNVVLAPNWSDVTIASTPAGATILVDNEDSGSVTPAVVEALAGEREIAIMLDGYKTHRQRIFAQTGQAMTLPPVTLIQADAQLRLSSTPNGAGVTVNGRFMGQTPVQLDLKSGQPHKLQLILNGYQTFTRTRTLQRGEVADLHADLRMQKGTVVVRSQPDGAQLSINGEARGEANQSLQLPIRPHTIAINLPGYAGYSQTITPKVGLTQEIKVKLLTLEEARLRAMQPNITTAAGQNLKLFKPYPFTMGASRREPGRRANETLREVEMSRLFYLSTHEVTNAQFRMFAAGHDSGKFVEQDLNADDMPVSSVGWHDAAAYCNWLSEQDNLPLFYDMEFGKVVGVNLDATGYRLPMEAEWAWAARTPAQAEPDGVSIDAQLRFPWGPNLPPPDRHGNYADRSASALVGRIIFGYNDNHTGAAPIGTFKPNQRGLYDMGGNVAEWMHDYYEIPGKQAAKDPTGPSEGEYHVMRGSSWMHGTITELRYSFRDYGIQGREDVGFRIARYAE